MGTGMSFFTSSPNIVCKAGVADRSEMQTLLDELALVKTERQSAWEHLEQLLVYLYSSLQTLRYAPLLVCLYIIYRISHGG